MSLTDRRRLRRFLQPHIFSRDCDDQISVSHDHDSQRYTTCTELSNIEKLSTVQGTRVSMTNAIEISSTSQHMDVVDHNLSKA